MSGSDSAPQVLYKEEKKFAIEHGKSKREIVGDFRICASRENLIWLAETILKECQHDFSYGWIDITACKQPSLVNTPTKKWDE